jgi:predicted dehydrogenase
MKKIKFAIVGCGRIAYRHIEAIQANPMAELVALCDLDLKRAQERNEGVKVKVYQDYRQMLRQEDIDVVAIMTPSGMHAEHALDIINSFRKHVLIEKPMCLKVEDGEALITAAAKNKVNIFVVHQNRFNKAVQKIKSAIDNRSFGKLVLGTVRIRWSRGDAYYSRDPWRGKWAFDGGALTNQAIHHIDLLRWLVGDVESLSAVAVTRLVNVEVEDTACVWLKFKNGALGAIEATTATRPLNKDIEASISILGENGVAIIEGASVNKLMTWTLGDIDLSAFAEEPPNVYGFGHDHIINNVVDVLSVGGSPLITAQDALASVKLLSAIYCSIESGNKEVVLCNSPVSTRLGVIDAASNDIANLYRTEHVLKGQKNG